MIMIYFYIILIFLIFSIQFISIREVNSSFEYFLKTLIIISLSISIFAIYETNGLTLYWSFVLITGYLIFKKKIFINQFSFKKLIYDLSYIFYTIPILILQFKFNYNFSKSDIKIPSDDIIIYAGYSKQIVEFGQENKYALFSHFYPKLFYGLNPYHFYEIWLNALVAKTNNYSSIYNLIFLTYPLLIWIVLIGLISILDAFKINKTQSRIFVILFLFIGPLYYQTYEFLFNDGNFVSYSVFTIPGFVKQTLPYSYFGQKHLPVIIFSILFINFVILKYWKGTLLGIHCLIVTSFGLFPGAYSMLFSIFFKVFKNKKYSFVLLSILSFFLFFGIINLNKLGISSEISKSTFYINHFLTNLNWKGELFRLLYKFITPIIWFIILYFPLVILILLNKKVLFFNRTFKSLIQLIIFSYVGAACFTLIIEGLNTEQFITNLLPFYNIVFITIIILIISNHKITNPYVLKINYLIFFLVIIQNFYFTLNFHENFKDVFNDRYQKTTQKTLITKLKLDNTKYIAYILSDSTLSKYHPMHQCIKLPAKFLYNHDYFNQVNINYPYYEYPKNSSYYSFAPYNQMKYFLKNKIIRKTSFPKEQIKFLRKFNIEWILCEKNAELPTKFNKYISDSIVDKISGEKYYKLLLYKNHS